MKEANCNEKHKKYKEIRARNQRKRITNKKKNPEERKKTIFIRIFLKEKNLQGI